MITVRTMECVLYKRHHIGLSRRIEVGQKEKRLESAKTLADDIILVKKIPGEIARIMLYIIILDTNVYQNHEICIFLPFRISLL